MRKLFLATAVALSASGLLARPAPAAPIDDAKAALAQKQYDKVDALLAADLAARAPSPAALRVSLDAAVASGRVVTADARATGLLKAAGEKDPDLLLLGARVADLAGDSHTALLRYLAYARQAAARSDSAEEAFRYVLRHETYPEEYKKYVALFGADARSRAMGSAQLTRLIEAADADRSLDLAAFLMQAFPEPEKVQAVQNAVYGAASGFVYGKDPKDRWVKPLLVLARAEPQSFGPIDQMLQQSASVWNEETRSRLILDVMARCKKPIGWGMLMQLGADLRAIKGEDARVAAAREYLSHEAVYQAGDDAESYYWFVRQIGESPQAFQVKGKTLVTGEALSQKLDALKARYPNPTPPQSSRLREVLNWVSQNYLANDPPARAAFLQKNLALLDRDRLGDLESLKPDLSWEQLVAQWAQGRPYATVLDARVQQARFYNQQKNKAGLVATMREYLTASPGTFVAAQVRENLIGSPLPDAGEKLAILKEAIDRGGYSKPMAELLAGMSQDATWAKDPALARLKADFDKKPAGSDPAARAQVALANLPPKPAQPDNAVAEIVGTFLAQYRGPVPGDEDKATDPQGLLVYQIWKLHAAHVWDNAAGVSAWAQTWAPRMPPGDNWRQTAQRLREQSAWPTLLKMVPAYAALARADRAHDDPQVWAQFMGLNGSSGITASPFTDAYDLMTTDQAVGWLLGMREAWGTRHQYLVEEWAKALAAPGAKLTDPGLAGQLVEHLYAWLGETGFKPPPAAIKAAWETYLASAQKTGTWNPDLEAKVYGVWLRSGKEHAKDAADFLTAWQQLIAKRTPDQQATAYAWLFHHVNPAADPAVSPADPTSRHALIYKVMKPLYEQVPPRQRDQVFVSVNVFPDINSQAAAAPPPDPKTNPKADPKTYPQLLAAWEADRAEALSFARTLVDLLEDGARFDASPDQACGLVDLLARDALARGDLPVLNRLLSVYAAELAKQNNSDGAWTNNLAPLLRAVETRGLDEPAYAFLTALQKKAKFSDAVARELMLARARAGTHIAGIIPVGPDDPAYDLYLAARALNVGDEQRAWELTGPKLALLLKDWPAMDPSYVAWSVEQLRKQKMLKDALGFAFNVLLHEAELDPDVAARVLLARGDVYRDMENYPAARIEYEGLRNNNRYNRTDAGSRAVFRLVDLAITTRDYSAADALLERLVDSDSVQKQADAWYLYAKMAFQKGDFKESRDDLKKVKERVLNHVEAALLEGELNLVLPGGLQNTEVAIGDPRLSTAVIPGRPLTLTLQDRNLSIARGGSAIPVVITAARSGDVEHVKLLPSSANRNLFTAKIATALGAGQKDNLTLELRGDDVVSYQIEPEFQKANDLHYEPKRLEVRYDARLAASSGEILGEEEQEKRDLERQMRIRQAASSRRDEVARDGRTVRPGGRIFVQVTDFCRDLTDAPDTVRVDLHTALGDTLEGVELTETGPHTGVFRGAVPTGLPLPRAAASDTAEAAPGAPANFASNVLQEAPGAGWTSLADGRKGKWLEVDTMTSNDVASLVADIPHLDQVKEVSVAGVLADDYEELAAYPPRPAQPAAGW